MNGIILLFLFFAFLGFLLAILFSLKRQGDRVANLFLAVYVLLFSFELLNNCLRWSGLIETRTFIHVNLTHFPLWLIYGPLVFLYVRRVVIGKLPGWRHVVFLVPPAIIVFLLFPFYSQSTADKLITVNAGRTYDFVNLPSYGIWLIIILMFFYGFLTYFSFVNKRRVGFRENVWLRCFVGSYGGFVLAFFAYVFLVRFGIMDPKYDYFIDILIVFFIGMLAFFGFVQPEVFAGKPVQEVLSFVKYRKTGMTESLSVTMRDKLLSFMDSERPYLNSELRLNDLADALGLSRNHMSQVINEHFNRSFFDFINSYRIEEAKKLLLELEESGSTVTQIAYDVGFNNRASFYKAFKKFTDQSPSAFKKKSRDLLPHRSA